MAEPTFSSLGLRSSMPKDPCPKCPIRVHCKRERVACAGWRGWAVKGRVDQNLLMLGLRSIDDMDDNRDPAAERAELKRLRG